MEAASQRRSSSQRGLTVVAVILALILIALLLYLFWYLGRPEVLAGGSRYAVKGVQPIWQVYGPGKGDLPRFKGPMGVAVGKGQRIYVTDSGNNRVCVFDSDGRFEFEFGRFGVAKPAAGVDATYEPGDLNYPVGIDTDDDGNVYVASFYNDSIEVFDAQGKPLRRFPDPNAITGEGGSGHQGLGIAVTDVAVHEDRVYATDKYQVLVFTKDGVLLRQWGKPGSGAHGLDHPNGIAVSGDGRTVYVSDANNSRVTAFTPEGKIRWQVGGASEDMSAPTGSELQLPRGLAVMPNGSVLVADAFGFELVRISEDGKIVARYGERGSQPGSWNFVNDVCSLRGYVVAADKGNGRVQMVRLLD